MIDVRDTQPSPLSELLEQYREGTRGMPTYDELAALLNAHAPLHIFGAANQQQNDQLARDAQAIVAADVAALASGRTLEKRMKFTKQQISIVARSLSDSAASECGIDKNDAWDIYSEQYLEEATSALEKLSAAAPQVVADEAFPAGSMPPSQAEMVSASLSLAPWLSAALDDLDVCDEYKAAINAWFNAAMPSATIDAFHARILDANHILESQLERAALQAAPVQAQEPGAGKPCPYCGSTDGAHDKAYPHPRAPVPPVAVPDGAILKRLVRYDALAVMDAGHEWGVEMESADDGRFVEFDDVVALFAAPAAQGDAKDAELARIKRLATCGTVDSFLLLPERYKRYWFAMAWQESDLRKLAEERIAFLHSTNKDADGYEFGIAKVKFDAAGKIESFLWGLGDNSDIDAAIAAKAVS